MSEVKLRKLPGLQHGGLAAVDEANRLLEQIRERAYALCADRGFSEGHALDDWLQAERAFGWPAAEFVENEKDYSLETALAGFEPSDVEVTVTPRDIVVSAKARTRQVKDVKRGGAVVHWSEFGSNDVYRRVELPSDVDVNGATATLTNGILRVVAPKAATQLKAVKVAAAA